MRIGFDVCYLFILGFWVFFSGVNAGRWKKLLRREVLFEIGNFNDKIVKVYFFFNFLLFALNLRGLTIPYYRSRSMLISM